MRQLADSYYDLGWFGEARTLHLSGLERSRSVGDRHHEMSHLIRLVGIERVLGRDDEARPRAAEALEIAFDIGDRLMLCDAFEEAAQCVASSQPEMAATLVGARRRASHEIGHPENVPTEGAMTDLLERLESALGPDRLASALQAGWRMGPAEAVASALRVLGEVGDGLATVHGPKLSRREREIVVLVAEGLTDAQIGEKLFISIRTVRSHLDRIKEKTGRRRRAELTRLAAELELLPHRHRI